LPQKEKGYVTPPHQGDYSNEPTIEGAGVKLQRAFGFGKTTDYDPFLLLDVKAAQSAWETLRTDTAQYHAKP